MILWTCAFTTAGGGLGPLSHPCGRAAKALTDAGYEFELRTVKGGSGKPWTWPRRAKDRAEVERLSGQRSVPIVQLDDGTVIAGSGSIADWAKANPATSRR